MILVKAVCVNITAKIRNTPYTDCGRFFSQLSCYVHYHIPVKSEVKRHQCKSPIGSKHMKASGKGTPFTDLEKRKGMTGKNDTADHRTSHKCQHKHNQYGLPSCYLRSGRAACPDALLLQILLYKIASYLSTYFSPKQKMRDTSFSPDISRICVNLPYSFF